MTDRLSNGGRTIIFGVEKVEVIMSIKDIRRINIIDVAVKLFLKESMADVKIKDVAATAGIGEATFYRYFPNRTSLIVACATYLQETIGQKYFVFDSEKTGIEMLESFYHRFLEMFNTHPELYKYLSEFDAYCTRLAHKPLEKYSENFEFFHDAYIAAYKEGLADGTVREIEDIDIFYYSSTHAMLSLCKKLAFEGDIVAQDALVDKSKEIKTLGEVFLYYLKKDRVEV